MAQPLEPIEFWFDFASPYAYFASRQIEGLAARHGRTVAWRPFLLVSAFKVTGARALNLTPMKNEYARLDWGRIASLLGIPFVLPPAPAFAVPATRAFYHLERESLAQATDFAKAVFDGYFDGRLDCGNADDVVALAVALGHQEAALRQGLADPAIKEKAIAASREAVARGVFGAPWIFVGDEPFWGWDRLPMVEQWLARAEVLASKA